MGYCYFNFTNYIYDRKIIMANRPKLNNNPFALIQPKPSAWKGLKGKTTDGFLIFDNPMYGTRAGFINFVNRYLNQGLDTIEKIFPVYAPSGHGANVPEDYINNVVKISGISRNKKISSEADIYKIGIAIVKHEEGNFWVPLTDFDRGFDQAMQSVTLNKALKTGTGIAGIIIFLIITLIYFL